MESGTGVGSEEEIGWVGVQMKQWGLKMLEPKWLQICTSIYLRVQRAQSKRASESFRELQRVSESFGELQRASESFRELQSAATDDIENPIQSFNF